MAVEDSPFRPQEETTHISEHRPDTVDRFKRFLGDLFKPKEKSTEENDEDAEGRSEKRGRFARAWRRLFRGTVAKTETIDEGAPKRGLFFELGGQESVQTALPEVPVQNEQSQQVVQQDQ